MKLKTKMKLTAVFEEAKEGGYIAYIEEMPGANTQGETLEEARENLMEALELLLDAQREIAQEEQKNHILIKEELEFV